MADPVLYLTTKELADLIRVRERKVYDLAAAGEVPFTRVTGKLLFPRHLIEAWLARHTELSADLAALPDPPPVAAGSHDPLLDWALRDSRSDIATMFDGSLDGLERFADRRALFCGLHVPEDASASASAPGPGPGEVREALGWNQARVAARFAAMPVVLVEWAWRERGLIVQPDNPLKIAALSDVAGKRFVPRQAEAGTQHLFRALADRAGLDEGAVSFAPPARSEQDVAVSVLNGHADAGLGLLSVAREYRLGFVPLARERFDLLVWRRSWFEPAFQTLLAFCRSKAFADRAEELGGYDIGGLGRVWFNGP